MRGIVSDTEFTLDRISSAPSIEFLSIFPLATRSVARVHGCTLVSTGAIPADSEVQWQLNEVEEHLGDKGRWWDE
jgi:hypothetical protein